MDNQEKLLPHSTEYRGRNAVPGLLPDASGLTDVGIIKVRSDVWRKPADAAGSEVHKIRCWVFSR